MHLLQQTITQPLFVVAMWIIAINIMCSYRMCLPPTMTRCIFHLLPPTMIDCIFHLLPPTMCNCIFYLLPQTMLCCIFYLLPPTMICCIFHLLHPTMIHCISYVLLPANERGNCDSRHQFFYVARFLWCNGAHCMPMLAYCHVTVEW